MSRMPWRNESRICRWPDGGFSSGPSREEKLRKRYPELQKKWKKCKRLEVKLADADDQFHCAEQLHGKTKDIAALKKHQAINKKYQKAKKDYKFLEKMLRDY